MNYDTSLYVKSYVLNRNNGEFRKNFLNKFVSVMKWKDGNDVVMDVGCGPGEPTVEILLATIPEVKTIIAIDVLPYMIDFAKLHHQHPKIQYHVADISDENTLATWMGKISKIYSTYCLQSMNAQEAAFQNMFRLLCKDGEAILFFTLNTKFYHCYDGILSSPKWQKFLEGVYIDIPDSQKMMYSSQRYKDLFEKIGFDVLTCEEEIMGYAFDNDFAAKESISSYCSITYHIPEKLKEDFKNDLFESFMKHHERDADGRPQISYCMLSVHIRKP